MKARARRPPADPVRYLKRAILLCRAALLLPPPAADALSGFARGPGAGTSCRALQVIDGDTLTLWCPVSGMIRARVIGYDAPELFGPGCGAELAAATGALWRLRWPIWNADELSIAVQGEDRYGRVLIRLAPDGADAAERMIAAGAGLGYAGGARGGWCGEAEGADVP